MQIFKEIEVADLHAMLEANESNLRIIDIRGNEDSDTGAIPGSELISFNELSENLDKLQKDQLVVLVCQLGVRSADACYYLSQKGFENVHNLRGGIQAWSQSGLKVA